MKKYGYTLAEALIAVAIIGVVAAVMLPLANKFKPDTTKITYLQTHDALAQALIGISSNDDIYPHISGTDPDTDFTRIPLLNTDQTTEDSHTYGGGAKKLCDALQVAFNGEEISACSDEYNPPNTDTDNWFEPNFITTRGIEFMVITTLNPSYQTDVYIDINGEDGDNCIHNADSCPNPDRFKFLISADGHLVEADPMGHMYMRNRTSWKKGSDDMQPNAAEGDELLLTLDNEWLYKKSDFPASNTIGSAINPVTPNPDPVTPTPVDPDEPEIPFKGGLEPIDPDLGTGIGTGTGTGTGTGSSSNYIGSSGGVGDIGENTGNTDSRYEVKDPDNNISDISQFQSSLAK